MIEIAFLTALLAASAGGAPAQERAGPLSPEERRVVAELGRQGVTLDPARGLCSVAARIEIRDDLLEYLLVGAAGAAHESAFSTDVLPSALNVAMLALGVAPGSNASWNPIDPPPTGEQLRSGASPYEVHPPEGDGFYLYVGWRGEGEVFFYRVEDLMRNLATGRSMRRHSWVYLGSRMVPDGSGGAGSGQAFAADIYRNLINVSFFSDGYTLVTSSLPECLEQTIWMLNGWLVPERHAPVRLFFSRQRMVGLPAELVETLPVILGPDSVSGENR